MNISEIAIIAFFCMVIIGALIVSHYASNFDNNINEKVSKEKNK